MVKCVFDITLVQLQLEQYNWCCVASFIQNDWKENSLEDHVSCLMFPLPVFKLTRSPIGIPLNPLTKFKPILMLIVGSGQLLLKKLLESH